MNIQRREIEVRSERPQLLKRDWLVSKNNKEFEKAEKFEMGLQWKQDVISGGKVQL